MIERSNKLEGVVISNDYSPIVIDIGHAYTKIGLAGDPAPRFLKRSVVTINEVEHKVFDLTGNEEFIREMFLSFLSHLIIDCMCLTPTDRGVLIVQDLMMRRNVRKAIFDVLLLDLKVQYLSFQSSHVCSLFTLGINTALVIDVGYSHTRILPVIDHFVIEMLYTTVHDAGFRNVYNSLLEILNNRNVTVYKYDNVISEKAEKEKVLDSLSLYTLEDIFIRCCFVNDLNLKCKPKDIVYEFDEYSLTIPGSLRSKAAEVLFGNDEDDDTECLSDIILNTIIDCPIDSRKSLANNILVIGGGRSTFGYMTRLQKDLHESLQKAKSENRTYIENFQFLVPKCEPIYTAWLGGSIYALTDSIKIQLVDRNTYSQGKRIRDWFEVSNHEI